MEIDLTTDGHVHTFLCHHARGEMEEYVQAALERGLQNLIFLEHLEIGISYMEPTWLTEEDFNYYLTEGHRLQQKYKGKLNIGLGVEVGYNPSRRQELLSFLKRFTWDRVGISYHFLEADGRHYNMVSKKRENMEALGRLGVEQVVRSYLQGVFEAIDSLPGDVLCHLDAVLRHHPGVHFNREHCNLLERILERMAQNRMTLEINTSGFDLRGEPFPSRWLAALAAERGVTLVAGSDAHRPRDVGRHFDRLPGWLAAG